MTNLNKIAHDEIVLSKSIEPSIMQTHLDFSPFKDELDKYQKNFAEFSLYKEFANLTSKLFHPYGQFTKRMESFYSGFPFNQKLISFDMKAFNEEFSKYWGEFSTNFSRINSKIHTSINIIEDDKEFKVEFEMPGLNEKNIKATIKNGFLTIKGEKKSSHKNQDKKHPKHEIIFGLYERTVELPKNLDVEKSLASFKNGMLWVTIPKNVLAADKVHELNIEKVIN